MNCPASVIQLFLVDGFTEEDANFFFNNPNSFIGGRKPSEIDNHEKLENLAKAFMHPADVF